MISHQESLIDSLTALGLPNEIPLFPDKPISEILDDIRDIGVEIEMAVAEERLDLEERDLSVRTFNPKNITLSSNRSVQDWEISQAQHPNQTESRNTGGAIRGATLREALCLIRACPQILNVLPHMILPGTKCSVPGSEQNAAVTAIDLIDKQNKLFVTRGGYNTKLSIGYHWKNTLSPPGVIIGVKLPTPTPVSP